MARKTIIISSFLLSILFYLFHNTYTVWASFDNEEQKGSSPSPENSRPRGTPNTATSDCKEKAKELEAEAEEHHSQEKTSTSILDKAEGLVLSDIQKYNIGQGSSLTEDDFDKIFPLSDHKDLELTSAGLYAGLITNDSLHDKFGTGTLLNIWQKDGKFFARGISALHVFLEKKKGKYTMRYCAPFGKFFYQNCHLNDEGKIEYFAKIIINNVLFSKELKKKDICLFEGEYIAEFIQESKTQEERKTLEDMIVYMNSYTPKVAQDESKEPEIESFMHHYPLGTLKQRKNEGTIFLNNAEGNKKKSHLMSSLPGSSGASIIARRSTHNEVIAIHIGRSDGVEKELKYKDSNLFVVKYNEAEFISEKDIEKISKHGSCIYELDNDNELYPNLVPDVYDEILVQAGEE